MAGLPIFMTSGIPQTRVTLFALKVLDPYFFQAVALLHCCVCLWVWERNQEAGSSAAQSNIIRAFKPIGILVFLFLVYYVTNDLVFKRSLGRARPSDEFRVTVGFISNYFKSVREGAPSGFAGRGVILVLVSSLAALGVNKPLSGWRKLFSDWRIVITTQSAFLLIACTARVFSGDHFWFDIMLGLSLAVFVFWGVLFLVSSVSVEFPQEAFEFTGVLLVGIVVWFGIIGFFYAREADAWAPSVVVMTSMALAAEVMATRRRRARSTSADSSVTLKGGDDNN